jgi:hypothetical protein
MEYLILTLIRLVVPLSILVRPLTGTVLAVLLDIADYRFIPIRTEADYHFYQYWDKILDSYYLGLAAYTARFWKDRLARQIAIGAFFYRLFGVGLFLLSANQQFLFFFPNFFENFFLFYLIYTRLTKRQILLTSKRVVAGVVLVILIPKLIQEYFVHVLQKVPSQLVDYDRVLVDATLLIGYLLIPALMLLWLRSRRPAKSRL